MTEDEAQAWLRDRLAVPRETMERLEAFIAFLLAEARHQNLISESTIPNIWARHIVDSAQLLPLAVSVHHDWLDLGSGAGFPGLVVATLDDRRMTLVESRAKRIAFLRAAAEQLGIAARTRVQGTRVEMMGDAKFDVISARAFAPLDKLFALAGRFATPDTLWLLPKGRSAATELEAVRHSWQGDFRIEPSVTDPDAAIIVARNVRPKGRR
ncbi:16S rRNA (guanine(527)-N(7))-methyltransferase RsmG [Sphingomonas oleivorans]|uniref:Ribosomal RNA small subunit methyltransferase G n=1 Tax=Sphingomonas oleivorans TaxID=1735121 RepID=A0A2T5G2P6_9SPHN|nr:16S rRNA (guanine(527)-N(7))-methyltransferase RsmG [Sphingomonas oleivorans]PTQ13415.1 16S rRNA (guanine(527)-N(7))-methyltransferase RsmG [Sphingomonas oleivorans]